MACDCNLKGLAKHGLLEIIEFLTIPFVGIIIKSIGFIATFIAAYEVISLLAGKQYGGHTEDGHEENHNTQNKVNVSH